MRVPQEIACDREKLSSLLAEELTPGEEAALSQHLAECESCQRALEEIAGSRPLWSEVRARVADEAVTSSWCTTEQIAKHDSKVWTESFLALLDPTDDPQMLGRLGCFEIRGIIGRGGNGIVLKAFEPRLNRFVAIKVLAPTLASSPAARRRFEREGRAIAAVSHEHVVPIYAVDEHRGLPYIVMQYFPAGTLQQRIDRSGPLETEEILRGAMHIASGLAAAHAQGIIHRDIKPANVLLENDVNRVLVTDFGLARIADDVALTQSGLVAGTPQFMSPEQARGEPIDERSDLFGLGSVMYVMCTGHAPFRAETVFGIIKRVCESTPRSIREINPNIPDWLETFIGRLMAKAPAQRFVTAAEVAALLSQELAHLQNPLGTLPPERSWMSQPSHNSRGPMGARIAAGVGGILLVGGWFFASGEKPAEEKLAEPKPNELGVVVQAVSNLKMAFMPRDAVQDRQQMMEQLGIALPEQQELSPIYTDPHRPAYAKPDNRNDLLGTWSDEDGNVILRSGFGLWVSYDSGNTGDYTPIDLLKMHDGTKITTADEWWSRRRPEMFDDVQNALWGRIPDADLLPEVAWKVNAVTVGSGENVCLQKNIEGVIDISRYPDVREAPKIEAKLRLPANPRDPVPVIVVMGDDLDLEPAWRFASEQGWGVCAFNCNRLQANDGGALTSYLIGLVNKGEWRKPSDWGALVAWSWGVSRLVDLFETDADVDATKIGVAGHGRYGKASIVAMAYEPRLVICYPSCAGALGTKMMRRHWGQEIETLAWDREYHWAAGNMFKWMGPLEAGQYKPRKLELMPVDAHSLLALAAPRPVFLNSGTLDTWSDPYGTYLTGANASPVYELLGKRGLVMPDDPPTPDAEYIDGDIGFRLHSGGHYAEPDWPTFVKFAKRYLEPDN